MIDTSADCRTRPETVDSLLDATGSIVSELVRPVLVSWPVKLGDTVAVIVPATVKPDRKSGPLHTTVGAFGLSAVPGSTGGTTSQPVAPGGGTTDTLVSPAGSWSMNCGLRAAEGPLLVAVKREVTCCPATGFAGLIVLTRARSAWPTTGEVTLAVSSLGAGSSVDDVTVVVLVTEVPANCEPEGAGDGHGHRAHGDRPSAHETSWPVTVQGVAVGPQVAVAIVIPAGTLSLTTTSWAVEGPLFVAAIV